MDWRLKRDHAGVPVGMTIHVREDRSSKLALESSPSRRLRIAIDDATVLWARIDHEMYGVSVIRPANATSPGIVAPIRANEARAHGGMIEEWMRFFARALDETPSSPLRRGTWQLTELVARGTHGDLAPRDPDELPAVVLGATQAGEIERHHFEEWGIDAPCRGIPLRALDDADAPRVKAWRKHVRDGTLPPILLWYVRGIELAIVLDGHDRLSAATAEGVVPPALLLWQVSERPLDRGDAWRDNIVAAVEQFEQRGNVSPTTRDTINRMVVDAFRPTKRLAFSTARATLDEARWDREIRDQVEDPQELAYLLQSSA